MKHLIACFLLVLSTGFVGWGQEEESPRYVCITMQGGLVRCGTLVSDDGIQVILDTPELGKVMLYKSSMVRIEDAEPGTYEAPVEVDIMSQDRMIDKDRAIQSSRYLFAPSAHSLREGEGYWNLSPVGGNITYALDDNTMAGLSASWLGYGFTFKQSFDLKEDFRMSVGGLMQAGWTGTATSTTNPDDLTVGSGYLFFPFLNATKGDENNNWTLGLGYLFGERVERVSSIPFGSTEKQANATNSPMINLSGCVQVGSRAWFVTENYYFFNPEYFPVNSVLSFGLRRWSDSWKWTNELAFLVLIEEGGNARPVPWLSLTKPF